jgi:hypothetical protein
MTRRAEEVAFVLALARGGLNSCEISRRTGIPRSTIVNWRHGRVPDRRRWRRTVGHAACLRCTGYREHPFPWLTDYSYAYLLGLYLGDGCLLRHPRNVYRLNVALDALYPVIVNEAIAAVAQVMPASTVSARRHPQHRYVEVNASSRHWPCLFPQHGPGRKHERAIRLVDWQCEILDRHPRRFLRGLIHSDGYRGLNTIKHPKKTYSYPRYQFSNRSADIRGIFCEYCDKLGIEWRQMNRFNISVARAKSVARMDQFVGPKR